MRVPRISHTVTFILILLGTMAWLPAQVTVEKDVSASTDLTGATDITTTIPETPPALPDPAEIAPPSRMEVRVTVDRLNVRARPGTSYEVVAKVNRDQRLTVVGEQDEWLEILPPAGTAAWCSSKFINDRNSVIGHNVRVRSGPGVVFSVFATLPEGASVTPVGAPVGQWQKIKVPAEATVWIHGQFVDPVESPPAAKTDAVSPPPVSDSDENEVEAPEPTKRPVPKLAVSDITTGDDEKTGDEELIAPKAAVPDKVGDTDLLPPIITQGNKGLDESDTTSITLSPPLEEGKTGTSIISVDQPMLETTGTKLPDFGEVSPLKNDAAEKEGLNNQKVTREGTVISLKSKATAFVTHALVRREGDKAYLLSYLISDVIDLNEWENRRVRLYGKPLDYPGWKTEALDTTGIQLLFP